MFVVDDDVTLYVWASGLCGLLAADDDDDDDIEEPCRSMGKDSSQYGRAVPQWPRLCHTLMMMMVLLTNVSCHAFIRDDRFGW